jgi:Protein of unknown function (DUF1064)
VSKYGNKKKNGYASQHEYTVAMNLEALEKCGAISNLEKQVKFELIPKQDGEKSCIYIADFTYTEDGKLVVADAKGFKTQIYMIKKKLMLYRYGIRIKEL